MNKQKFLENIAEIHILFNRHENHLNSLAEGIQNSGKNRDILDDFLDVLGLFVGCFL